MKKYYYCPTTSKTYQENDTIKLYNENKEIYCFCKLNAKMINFLINTKIIYELNIDSLYNDIIIYISESRKINLQDVELILLKMSKLSPESVYHYLLRILAILTDSAYKNHILECETLYTISRLDNKIIPIKSDLIKNTLTIPLFRNVECAYLVKNAIKIILMRYFERK